MPAFSSPIHRSELPRLELLQCFEAAARMLSFTQAAAELSLTQSAVSRQIQQLEASVKAQLFERRHRALALTEAGRVMQRTVVDCLERLRDATALVRASVKPVSPVRQVAVTTTPGFASLWLIPRLAKFTASHPDVDVRLSAALEVLDLARNNIDLAVRFCLTQDGVGQPLFEESVLPMCAPQLLNDPLHPLREPADLAHHTLLGLDIPKMSITMDWEPWFTVMGLQSLRMKNTLRFSQYPDAVAAAIAGQGVVIGRLPLLNTYLDDGRLVVPFQGKASSRRAYFIAMAPGAAANADAQDFARWLVVEAEAEAMLPYVLPVQTG